MMESSPERASGPDDEGDRDVVGLTDLGVDFFCRCPLPALVVGEDLLVHEVNHALTDLRGVAQEYILGRPISELGPHGPTVLEPLCREVLRTGRPAEEARVALIGSEGDPARQCLVRGFPVGTGGAGAPAVGLIVLDVSADRRTMEDRGQEVRVAETLQQVGRSVVGELDVQSVVQQVTDAATSLTGAQFGAFF